MFPRVLGAGRGQPRCCGGWMWLRLLGRKGGVSDRGRALD